MSTVPAEDEQVYDHEGLLWKRLPECTSTFEEFIEAGAQWMRLVHEVHWSPWREAELQQASDRARAVREQWTRAERDHRMMTDAEVTDWMAELDRQYEARRDGDEAHWKQAKKHYSPEREQARYALLEREALRARLTREIEDHRWGAVFPGMSADMRAKRIASLESDREQNEREILRLAEAVGDPETVIDANGRLPRDRRPLKLVGYDCHRRFRVEELRSSIASQPAELATKEDRAKKSSGRGSLTSAEHELNALIAVPRLTPEEMCADCDTPLYQHHEAGTEGHGCPRWPMRAARMKQAWENVRFILERHRPAEAATSKPTPLATLPGTLPIADVISRLSELQAKHPDAVIKRGRANRWELWPPGT